MSDNWIEIVPQDPDFVPALETQNRAKAYFEKIAPNADEVTITAGDTIKFFDCGANFQSIHCPECASEIDMDWWGQEMSQATQDDGFILEEILTPCCHVASTLNNLLYDWPQAFGRFCISAMNPDIGTLTDNTVAQFEAVLGCRITVVYQHI